MDPCAVCTADRRAADLLRRSRSLRRSCQQRLSEFFAGGGQGLNVTVPHKQAVLPLLDELSQRARTAGAVNVISRTQAGRLRGDNTDGSGFVRDLTRNLGLTVTGLRVLLLGAGGAARGLLEPLLALAPRRTGDCQSLGWARTATGKRVCQLWDGARLQLRPARQYAIRTNHQRHRRRSRAAAAAAATGGAPMPPRSATTWAMPAATLRSCAGRASTV